MHMRARLTAALGVLIFGLTGSIAEAATIDITWGSPTTIVGDSDVSTTGTRFHAVSFGATGATDRTVNTVAFTPLNASASGTAGPISSSNGSGGTITLTKDTGSNLFGFDSATSTTNPFNSLSTAYKDLLSHYNYGGLSRTLSISGLSPNTPYEVQIFYNDPRANQGASTTYDSAEVTLDGHTGTDSTAGGVGQYAIGTFTTGPSDTQQAFTVSTINAFQIRVVPEPSAAFAAMTVGGLGLLARRRRGAAC
jgi:hypothetical protein